MTEFASRAEVSDVYWSLGSAAQDANDLCPSPLLTCIYTSLDPQRYPTVIGGEGTVTITAQAPISKFACDAIAGMQPGFDVPGCKVVLDMTDQSAEWTPQSLYLGIRGGVVNIGEGTGAQPDAFLAQINNYVGVPEGGVPAVVQGVEVVPSDPNIGSTPGAVPPVMDLGCWGTVATVVLAVGFAGAMKIAEVREKRKVREPHPHRNIPKLRPNDFDSDPEYHSRTQFEGRTEEQAARERALMRTATDLTNHGIKPRPAGRLQKVFGIKRHQHDREFLEEMTELRETLKNTEYVSLLDFVERKVTIAGSAEVYKEAHEYQKHNGIDGPVVVDDERDHIYYVPGKGGARKLLDLYRSMLPKKK